MNSENAPAEKKRRVVSIPFLIIVVIIGLVGYFRGEEIMTYAMYLQEQWKHNSEVSRDREYDKRIGPPKEGQYDWVAPDANENEPAGNDNVAEEPEESAPEAEN